MLPTRSDQGLRHDPQALALFCSAVVRNHIEEFHIQHLSDAQMRELNPLYRNAIYSALHAAFSMDRSAAARAWVAFMSQYIAPYWETPELIDGYIKTLESRGEHAEDLSQRFATGHSAGRLREAVRALRTHYRDLVIEAPGAGKAVSATAAAIERTRLSFHAALTSYLTLQGWTADRFTDADCDRLLSERQSEFEGWLDNPDRPTSGAA